MAYFLITLTNVAVMLAYAVPGYLLGKTKAVKADAAGALSKILLYVAQPMLTIDSFGKANFSWELLKELGIFAALCVAIHALVLGVSATVLAHKGADARKRVCCVASAFGNCAFMGVPLVESLLPEFSAASVFAMVFFLVMSLLGWTLGSALIAGDRKYVSWKKALLNPAVISLVVALPLFFTGAKLPAVIGDAVNLLGRMTTPLCMLVMGIRLATVSPKAIFADPLQYVAVAVKQIAMPLAAFLLVWWLPVAHYVKVIFFVLCATPVASVVLAFAEIIGEGRENAANLVLLGTVFSVVTMPLLALLL